MDDSNPSSHGQSWLNSVGHKTKQKYRNMGKELVGRRQRMMEEAENDTKKEISKHGSKSNQTELYISNNKFN